MSNLADQLFRTRLGGGFLPGFGRGVVLQESFYLGTDLCGEREGSLIIYILRIGKVYNIVFNRLICCRCLRTGPTKLTPPPPSKYYSFVSSAFWTYIIFQEMILQLILNNEIKLKPQTIAFLFFTWHPQQVYIWFNTSSDICTVGVQC